MRNQNQKTVDAARPVSVVKRSIKPSAGDSKPGPERAPDDTAPATDSVVAPMKARPSVLCIDDDPDFSAMLKLRLNPLGIDVVQAFAGTNGYRSAFMQPAQAVILDYEMPDGNGEYVLRRLKESPITDNIPVIVLTGRRDLSLERKMYNMGASAFLTKPCPWESLWRTLQTYLPPA